MLCWETKIKEHKVCSICQDCNVETQKQRVLLGMHKADDKNPFLILFFLLNEDIKGGDLVYTSYQCCMDSSKFMRYVSYNWTSNHHVVSIVDFTS